MSWYLPLPKEYSNLQNALHSSVGASAGKGFHFSYCHEVEVAGDGLLQSGSRYCEFEGLALSLLIEKAIDEAAGEGVAAA